MYRKTTGTACLPALKPSARGRWKNSYKLFNVRPTKSALKKTTKKNKKLNAESGHNVVLLSLDLLTHRHSGIYIISSASWRLPIKTAGSSDYSVSEGTEMVQINESNQENDKTRERNLVAW